MLMNDRTEQQCHSPNSVGNRQGHDANWAAK